MISTKVEAAEVSRVLSMLEEEIERREQGDNKAIDLATRTEELVNELAKKPSKKLSVHRYPEVKKVQTQSRGESELKTFEKSLSKKLKKGLQSIAKIVEKSTQKQYEQFGENVGKRDEEEGDEEPVVIKAERETEEAESLADNNSPTEENGSVEMNASGEGSDTEKKLIERRISEVKQNMMKVSDSYSRSKSATRSAISPYLTMRAK